MRFCTFNVHAWCDASGRRRVNETIDVLAHTRADVIVLNEVLSQRRLWEDDAEVGFLDWQRHADVVVMSAELELAAWSLDGKKLWTTFVEPPWTYTVTAGQVELDVMGNRSRFDLRRGPG